MTSAPHVAEARPVDDPSTPRLNVTATHRAELAADRIAFQRTLRFGGTNIFTAAPDGTDRQKLTRGGHSTNPRWSRNGGRIAYTHDNAVWVMRADGTHQHRVLGNAWAFSWSPDGRKLLVNREFAGGPRFGIFNLRAATARWYPTGQLRGGMIGWDWSWTTNRIMFAGYLNSDASADIYTVAPDFSGREQVTDTPSVDEIELRWAPQDPERIAFYAQNWKIPDTDPCHNRLVVLDVTTAQRTRVRCDAERPAWSPDGTHLLAAQHIWNSPDYDLVNIDLANDQGTVVIPHTNRFLTATSPDWTSS
jgi:Tol biopolymer transport system component